VLFSTARHASSCESPDFPFPIRYGSPLDAVRQPHSGCRQTVVKKLWPVARASLVSRGLQDFMKWRDPESNRGHHDFQSCALPTELSRRRRQRGDSTVRDSSYQASDRAAELDCLSGLGEAIEPEGRLDHLFRHRAHDGHRLLAGLEERDGRDARDLE
jgi:hypothetical protein